MRIIDWSSDVCSSDLSRQRRAFIARAQTAEHYDVSSDLGCHAGIRTTHQFDGLRQAVQHRPGPGESHFIGTDKADQTIDRQSVVEGKSVSLRVTLGARSTIKKKKNKKFKTTST